MKRLFDWLVRRWWAVPCFLVLQLLVIALVLFVYPGGWLENIAFILWCVAFLLELVLQALLLVRKRW